VLLDPAFTVDLEQQEQVFAVVGSDVLVTAPDGLEVICDLNEIHATCEDRIDSARDRVSAMARIGMETAANRNQPAGPFVDTIVAVGSH
jgi:hypothetical protein